MATIALNRENFEQVVLGHDMVIVDFWAAWCGPCKSFAPVFEAAAEKHGDVVFAKVNTDEEQDLAGTFDIRSIPTLMVFREQVLVFSQPGALSAPMLEQLLERVKDLDMDEVREKEQEAVEGVSEDD